MVMVLITTASALRNSVSSVRARGAGQRSTVNVRCQPVFNQAGEQRPANRREEQDQRDTNQHINRFLPAAVMHPLPEIEQPPCAEQQHNRHADRQMRAAFSDAEIQPLSRFLQFRIVTLGFRRQGDGFRNPARQNTGDQRGGADDGQAA